MQAKSNWIEFSQYQGFAITADAKRIRTLDGEFDLTPGKLFYFINPNSGVKNFATPEVLISRALNPKSIRKAASMAPKPKKAKAIVVSTRLTKDEKVAKKELDKVAKLQEKVNRSKRKVQLLPDEVADKLRAALESESRKNMAEDVKSKEFERGVVGFYVDYNKQHSVRVLAWNLQENLLLVKNEGPQDWRLDTWFYNPVTEKYSQFIKERDKPGYGDKSIVWPTNLDGEHLLGANHEELRHKREAAAEAKKAKKRVSKKE